MKIDWEQVWSKFNTWSAGKERVSSRLEYFTAIRFLVESQLRKKVKRRKK